MLEAGFGGYMQKEKSRKKIICGIILSVIAAAALLIGAAAGAAQINAKPAQHSIEEYRKAFPDVAITVSDDGTTELLPETGDSRIGIIFYCGAFIRPEAYIPLMARVSEQGYFCSIPKLTFNMAPLSQNIADTVICDHPEIETWYIGGHSMGGCMASGFAADNENLISGLIFVASYPYCDMSDTNIPILSVLGDKDGVLRRERYEERRSWNTPGFEEYTVNGANHAGFGDYGKQARDNEAAIPAEEQQKQAAEIICSWINEQTAGKQ